MSDDAGRAVALRRIEDRILAATGNRWKRLVFLDPELNVLFVADGEFDEVRVAGETVVQWFRRADTVTHNHPLGTTFSDRDMAAAIALDVRELHAFGVTVRYRFVRRLRGRGWPTWPLALSVIRQIDADLRPRILPRVAAGELSPIEAQALHRRMRWRDFARRFSADVDYIEEQR